ncbi:sigma 54-interacting transcriptional regulator [Microvirga pudoricolor]|uniref:sigma 54-interacting transcriptional regulator n=1 Tax=Microvirga pudoricolor TaxID=2778729 RepID=UPI00194F6050|nr:sigma 54-interacting transcriptional regulator [Microvirga pudoricolor]MBM6594952.1 sigma-54-dependent Fis family transcriptional regulator [Microvirga pudoricolor]
MLLTSLLADTIRALRDGGPGSVPALHDSRAMRQAERASRTALPVLIEGEPGTGGDALARAVHDCGDRRSAPFVRCHADDSSLGLSLSHRLAEAHGGTLLVQGVESLGSGDQGTLLRLLQERDADGGRRPGRPDVRVIALTDGHLIERVRDGSFRDDLFYRLNILPVTLQPLRARRELVGPLARHLMGRFAAEEGKRIAHLSPEAESLLAAYDWPGNVRQLENAVFRAVLLAEGLRLTPTEFPQIVARTGRRRIDVPPAPLAFAPEAAALPPALPDPQSMRLTNEDGEVRSLAVLEAEIIRFALIHYGGHMSAVSRHLGIGRSTLYRKLKELGLESGVSHAA